MWAVGIGMVTSAVVGFLAGMLTFHRSLLWCRECGETLTCANCLPRPEGR
jgi:hypothetical protein